MFQTWNFFMWRTQTLMQLLASLQEKHGTENKTMCMLKREERWVKTYEFSGFTFLISFLMFFSLWGEVGGGTKSACTDFKYSLHSKKKPPNFVTFPDIYFATIWYDTPLSWNLMFLWQPYFSRHVFQNFFIGFYQFLKHFDVFYRF